MENKNNRLLPLHFDFIEEHNMKDLEIVIKGFVNEYYGRTILKSFYKGNSNIAILKQLDTYDNK